MQESMLLCGDRCTRMFAFSLLFFLSLHPAVGEDCSGHGHVDEHGVCVCDTPWPTGTGSKGWVGESCQVPVFPIPSDDNVADMSADCAKTEQCNILDDDDWVCFNVSPTPTHTPDNTTASWNHIAFLLNKTVGGGDADLFGFFPPSTNTTTTPPPPSFSQASGFAFSDTSTARKAPVLYHLSKSDFPDGTFDQGYYVCVHNYPGSGSLTYTLAASKSQCRASYDLSTGQPLVCSSPRDAGPGEPSRRYSECSAQGECICTPPYAKPVPQVVPGIGFDSCAAEVTQINTTALGDEPYLATDQSIQGGRWKFWAFNTTEEDYEVVITVAERGSGHVSVFSRFSQPPSAKAGEFDERSAYNPAPGQHEHSIILDSAVEGTRVGLFFIGVFGTSEEGGIFDIAVQRFLCPSNCSSNGLCNPAAHTCTCAPGYGGRDCSEFSSTLAYGQMVEKNSSAVFEYEYYTAPGATEAMAAGNSEVKITAMASSEKWNVHLTARPEVLLYLDASSTSTPLFPKENNFTDRMVLDLNTPHVLTLCSSRLTTQPWKLGVHNPLPSIPLNYSLTIEKIGRCLNDCFNSSGQGGCSEDGVCKCAEGWVGGDCSVRQGGAPPSPPHHHHPLLHLFGLLFWMAFGAGLSMAYAVNYGIPLFVHRIATSIRNRNQHSDTVGLYQELTDAEGV